MQYFFLITGALLLAYIVYFSCNKGMARNARGQQTRRLGVAAVLACIPLTVAQVPVLAPSGDKWVVDADLSAALSSHSSQIVARL